jgi:hypothetical protein
MRTFDRIVYGLLIVLVVGLFLSASAQVTPTIPNPSRVYGARMQGFTSHPAIGYEFFDATGTTNSHRYAYIRQQGGMVLSSSLAITNGRTGATVAHWDKDGTITVTGCTGCGGAPDPLTANGWTPASGTGTFTGIYKLAATGTGSATDTYISRDLSNNFVINAPSTGGFYALNGNAASFFSGPSGGGNRAIISGNGASDGLVVGGTLVINGQSSGVGFNALTAAGPSSIGATTVSTLKVGGGATVSQLAGVVTLTRGTVAAPGSATEGAAFKMPNVGNATIDTCYVGHACDGFCTGAGTCTDDLYDKTASSVIGSCTYTCGTPGTNASCFTTGTLTAAHVYALRVTPGAASNSPDDTIVCDYTY